jgi:hypothetical protein
MQARRGQVVPNVVSRALAAPFSGPPRTRRHRRGPRRAGNRGPRWSWTERPRYSRRHRALAAIGHESAVWLIRTGLGSRLEDACAAEGFGKKGKLMYIGIGTIVLIVIIVLVVLMLRRR